MGKLRSLQHGYGPVQGIDDIMSRLATIGDGTNTYAAYKYLGAGRIVEEDYAAPDVRLSYDPDGDNSFSALDRFGRVLDQLWERYGQTPVVLDHYSYTYDRAGNRTSRTNELNHDFDELYDYDGIDRLISSTRADDFDQSWTLDGLGNFAEFDDDGDTQTRTVNGVNEIAGITGGWITPSYDAAGNMISGPKPGDETTRVHYVYDAWNRLVKVYDDDSGDPGNLIAEYEYDGTNRRIEKIVASTSHAHYYFNHDWQLLEERFVDEEDELLAANQYVWSARYIDAPVVRFHDGNGDGDLLDVEDNIRYYTGDANYNVTATIDAATGEVVDRYVYTAYGRATVYDDDWSDPSAPTTDGPLYCGYFFDAESGLYQVRNRYYDAGLSTFISRDPIGLVKAGPNLYRYADNNAPNRTDPSGLFSIPQNPLPSRPTLCCQTVVIDAPAVWLMSGMAVSEVRRMILPIRSPGGHRIVEVFVERPLRPTDIGFLCRCDWFGFERCKTTCTQDGRVVSVMVFKRRTNVSTFGIVERSELGLGCNCKPPSTK